MVCRARFLAFPHGVWQSRFASRTCGFCSNIFLTRFFEKRDCVSYGSCVKSKNHWVEKVSCTTGRNRVSLLNAGLDDLSLSLQCSFDSARGSRTAQRHGVPEGYIGVQYHKGNIGVR